MTVKKAIINSLFIASAFTGVIRPALASNNAVVAPAASDKPPAASTAANVPAQGVFDSRLSLMFDNQRVMFYKGLFNSVDVDNFYHVYDKDRQVAYIKVIWVEDYSAVAVIINRSVRLDEGVIYTFKWVPAGIAISPRPGKYNIPHRETEQKAEQTIKTEVLKPEEEIVKTSNRHSKAGTTPGEETEKVAPKDKSNSKDKTPVDDNDGSLKLKDGGKIKLDDSDSGGDDGSNKSGSGGRRRDKK